MKCVSRCLMHGTGGGHNNFFYILIIAHQVLIILWGKIFIPSLPNIKTLLTVIASFSVTLVGMSDELRGIMM